MKLVFKLIRWLGWPLFWLLLHNTHRTRVLLTCGGEILLVRDRLEALSGDAAWGLPGGGKHRNEDLARAAVREVREEVGMTISPEQLRSIGETSIASHRISYHAHLYEAKINEKFTPKIQRLELAQAAWFNPKDLIKQPLKPEVLYALGHMHKR